MIQFSTSDPFSFFSDKDTHTVLFKHWQALRRSEKYQRAAQECLTHLKALYDQWIAEQQTLHPPAPLSPHAAALATDYAEKLRRVRSPISLAIAPPKREEKHLLLLDLFLDNEGVLQTLPAEAHRAIMLELVTYWDWEDLYDRLKRHIAKYERLINTLECATNFFRSWDPSLESLPGQPSKLSEPDQAVLDKFTGLCSDLHRHPVMPQKQSALLQQFLPLETLSRQHCILLPLDHRIPQLPFRAAWSVFPNILPSPARTYKRSQPVSTNIVTFSRMASRESVYKVIKSLLPAATSRLSSYDRYSKAFRVYDLKQAYEHKGKKMSWADIGREVLPEDFEKIKPPYNYNNKAYRKAIQHTHDLFNVAKNHIDNA